MKLTYWIATDNYALENPDDEEVAETGPQHIRGGTRKAVKELVAELVEEVGGDVDDFGKPAKHVLEYSNGFDLLEQCANAQQGNGLFTWEDSSNEEG